MATDNEAEIKLKALELVQQYISKLTTPLTPDEFVKLTGDMMSMLRGQSVSAPADQPMESAKPAGATEPVKPVDVPQTGLSGQTDSSRQEGSSEQSLQAAANDDDQSKKNLAKLGFEYRMPWMDETKLVPQPPKRRRNPRQNERDPVRQGPACTFKESYGKDFVRCMEDGHRLMFLKRHLKTFYDMTVEEYLWKWQLPADHPVVAPSYTRHRKRMIKRQQAKMQEGRTRGASA